jgi:CIC family chloride channel protein
MLGMCAMMAAVLQAPLAALMAVMEMTANTNLILPAMVTIVAATMVTSQVFRQRSVFIATLNTLGLEYPPNPVTMHLQRVGASAIMDRSFVRLRPVIPGDEAREALAKQPNWILVDDDEGQAKAVLNPSDLAAFLDERGADEAEIRLLHMPGQRMDVTSIGFQATALQVQEALSASQTEACCITRTTAPMIRPVVGIVTRSHIENYRNLTE